MEDLNPLHYCDITPWYNEICTRMHEANATGQAVVNLSGSHPRGYIPPIILRRPAIRALLKDWTYDATREPGKLYPVGNVWMPAMGLDLTTCDLTPFINEIELRVYEAEMEAYNKALATGTKQLAVLDTTNNHPRGGIPEVILNRLERRKSMKWVAETRAEIDRLRGEANKAEAFSKTQRERAEGAKDNGKDPTALLHSAEQLLVDAAFMRAQAKFLESEIGHP